MTVIDILFRVDEICKKYDKYDIEKQRDQNAFGDDAFARIYAAVEADIQAALTKSEMAVSETNRAAAAAMNAEVRRTKARLTDEMPKLKKLALKKVKGLSKEDYETRGDLVILLLEKIAAIPDGTMNAAKQTGGWGTSSAANPGNIKFDTTDGNFSNDFYEESEESSQFRQEYETRKMKQDQGLDVISEGLDTLKNLAQDMNEEMDRQIPLMDDIEDKVDRAASDLKNTNVRLKETIIQDTNSSSSAAKMNMSQVGINSTINTRGLIVQEQNLNSTSSNPNPKDNIPSSNSSKRKRNLPGNPDPDAEVVAMSPKSLMATNRFLCEICNKGFQRDQNLQLHRRGHNLPWKLKQRSNKEIVKKKVYICPEKTCVHHDPSRALVQSDWKAHSKICGTREYRCDCGTLFSRKDSFITHRAFCDALAEENSRFIPNISSTNNNIPNFNISTEANGINLQTSGILNNYPSAFRPEIFSGLDNGQKSRMPSWLDHLNNNPMTQFGGNLNSSDMHMAQMGSPMNMTQLQGPKEELEEELKDGSLNLSDNNMYTNQISSHNMSATALLQKAAQIGSTRSNPAIAATCFGLMNSSSFNLNNKQRRPSEGPENLHELVNSNTSNAIKDGLMDQGNMTRDFLGVSGEHETSRRLILQQQLANFASMNPTMDQYNGYHY
ncbi:hypothetical protein ACFE04_015640 [Oxalis oulophora]